MILLSNCFSPHVATRFQRTSQSLSSESAGITRKFPHCTPTRAIGLCNENFCSNVTWNNGWLYNGLETRKLNFKRGLLTCFCLRARASAHLYVRKIKRCFCIFPFFCVSSLWQTSSPPQGKTFSSTRLPLTPGGKQPFEIDYFLKRAIAPPPCIRRSGFWVDGQVEFSKNVIFTHKTTTDCC